MTRRYVQHNSSYAIHIVRAAWENGTWHTQCGKWYIPSMAREVDLHGEREEDIVCRECRLMAAKVAGKKTYRVPELRRGLSKTKQRLLRNDVQAAIERQRLAAWNKAAQAVQDAN